MPKNHLIIEDCNFELFTSRFGGVKCRHSESADHLVDSHRQVLSSLGLYNRLAAAESESDLFA